MDYLLSIERDDLVQDPHKLSLLQRAITMWAAENGMARKVKSVTTKPRNLVEVLVDGTAPLPDVAKLERVVRQVVSVTVVVPPPSTFTYLP